MFKIRKSAAVILPLLLASGCLYETTVDENGGATLQVSYMLKKNIDVTKQPDMVSKYVELTSASQDADGMGHFHLKTKDITKLPTAKMFREAEISRTVDKEKGTTTIDTKIKHVKKSKVPDSLKKYFGDQVKFVATVPGEITETNATSKEGKTATWVFTMDEFFGAKEVPLHVTYKNPS